MTEWELPEKIDNLINGADSRHANAEWFVNTNPHNGEFICDVARSRAPEVEDAIDAAAEAFESWSESTPIHRADVLYEIIDSMVANKERLAELVAVETGKSMKAALGETGGAIACARFFAGEGQRFFGKTMPSGADNKYAMTIREPVGIAGLIVPANTPIANIAWKVFPALICGNTVVLKGSEDAPLTSWLFGKIAHESSLPKGVLNIVHGYGTEAGAPIVESDRIDIISFTGSTRVGRYICEVAGRRLARVSLELGGKNPLIVCNDADIPNAVKWASLSAFSNAGQRCASGSRLIACEGVYEEFLEQLVDTAENLTLGVSEDDDLGPVINEAQLNNMLSAIENAKGGGANVLVGGSRLNDDEHRNGFYMAPTVIDNSDPKTDISTTELFGPVTNVYKVKDYEEAIEVANNSPYGLTATIHTTDFNKAIDFTRRIKSGVAVVNGGTYGSEPHMPFGGVKQSGNGTREPGTEALDVYSNLKDVYMFVDKASTT